MIMPLRLIFVLISIGVALCNSVDDPQYPIALQESYDSLNNIKPIIDRLVRSLKLAAKIVQDAIKAFTKSMEIQVKLYQDNLKRKIAQIREKINEIIKIITDSIKKTGRGVSECISNHRNQAEAVLADASSKALDCADSRVSDIFKLIATLTESTRLAADNANLALKQMQNCTNNSDGIIKAGGCVASLGLQKQMQSLSFVAYSGLMTSRINLAIANLPAALEVCAGGHLWEASVSTTKIAAETGKCAIDSFVNALTERGSTTLIPLVPDGSTEAATEGSTEKSTAGSTESSTAGSTQTSTVASTVESTESTTVASNAGSTTGSTAGSTVGSTTGSTSSSTKSSDGSGSST